MNNIWLMVFGVMIFGNILKYYFYSPFIAAIIDLGVLGAAYLILRRYPYVDLKRSMTFLAALTGIVILVDLAIINGAVGNIAMLALLAWMFFGSSRKGSKPLRPPRLWHK